MPTILQGLQTNLPWATMYAELLPTSQIWRVQVRTCLCGWSFQWKIRRSHHPRATSLVPLRSIQKLLTMWSQIPQPVPLKLSTGPFPRKSVYLTDDGSHRWPRYLASSLPNYAIYVDALFKVPSGQPETDEGLTPNYHYNWAGVDAPAHTSYFEKLGFQIVNTPEEADVVIPKAIVLTLPFCKKPTSSGSHAETGKIGSSCRIWRLKN